MKEEVFKDIKSVKLEINENSWEAKRYEVLLRRGIIEKSEERDATKLDFEFISFFINWGVALLRILRWFYHSDSTIWNSSSHSYHMSINVRSA